MRATLRWGCHVWLSVLSQCECCVEWWCGCHGCSGTVSLTPSTRERQPPTPDFLSTHGGPHLIGRHQPVWPLIGGERARVAWQSDVTESPGKRSLNFRGDFWAANTNCLLFHSCLENNSPDSPDSLTDWLTGGWLLQFRSWRYHGLLLFSPLHFSPLLSSPRNLIWRSDERGQWDQPLSLVSRCFPSQLPSLLSLHRIEYWAKFFLIRYWGWVCSPVPGVPPVGHGVHHISQDSLPGVQPGQVQHILSQTVSLTSRAN